MLSLQAELWAAVRVPSQRLPPNEALHEGGSLRGVQVATTAGDVDPKRIRAS
jgi:hypothetical protein